MTHLQIQISQRLAKQDLLEATAASYGEHFNNLGDKDQEVEQIGSELGQNSKHLKASFKTELSISPSLLVPTAVLAYKAEYPAV